MNARIALGGLLLVSAQVGATDAAQRITGTVWEGSSQAAKVSFNATPGKPARVITQGGHELEVSLRPDGSTLIRLLDSAGKQLHSATTPPGEQAEKSFRYTVCGEKVSYSSPEPADIPACSEA